MSSSRYRVAGLCSMRLAVAETAAELHPAGNCPVVESFLVAQIAAVEIAAVEIAAAEIVVAERLVGIVQIAAVAGILVVEEIPAEVGRILAAVEENFVAARLTAEFLALGPTGCW